MNTWIRGKPKGTKAPDPPADQTQHVGIHTIQNNRPEMKTTRDSMKTQINPTDKHKHKKDVKNRNLPTTRLHPRSSMRKTTENKNKTARNIDMNYSQTHIGHPHTLTKTNKKGTNGTWSGRRAWGRDNNKNGVQPATESEDVLQIRRRGHGCLQLGAGDISGRAHDGRLREFRDLLQGRRPNVVDLVLERSMFFVL